MKEAIEAFRFRNSKQACFFPFVSLCVCVYVFVCVIVCARSLSHACFVRALSLMRVLTVISNKEGSQSEQDPQEGLPGSLLALKVPKPRIEPHNPRPSSGCACSYSTP